MRAEPEIYRLRSTGSTCTLKYLPRCCHLHEGPKQQFHPECVDQVKPRSQTWMSSCQEYRHHRCCRRRVIVARQWSCSCEPPLLGLCVSGGGTWFEKMSNLDAGMRSCNATMRLAHAFIDLGSVRDRPTSHCRRIDASLGGTMTRFAHITYAFSIVLSCSAFACIFTDLHISV